MSSGYNDRLSPLKWKGECGDKETEESRDKWTKKARELVEWMRASTHTVAFTGAGISCSSGIPDFRGPKGVWTLEKKGKKVEFDVPFEDAQPSFTHMALVALMNAGYLHYVVSQNVDGLHLKSGIPRDRLSELHGNIFAEKCDKCLAEYIRPFDVGGMGYKVTGRLCDNPLCQFPLRDTACDWESPLPEAEFDRAIDAHKRADLALCLGTSLRIRPAGNMPLRTLRKHNKTAPGRLVIVNLQKTHLDRNASMRMHVRTDALFREICRLLEVQVDHHDPKAAEEEVQAQAAAAASSAAAAAMPPPPPRVVKVPRVYAPSVGRPTRSATERLRPLYNPPSSSSVKVEEPPAAAASSSSSFYAAAASSSAAAASSSGACAAASSLPDELADSPPSTPLLMRCASASSDYAPSPTSADFNSSSAAWAATAIDAPAASSSMKRTWSEFDDAPASSAAADPSLQQPLKQQKIEHDSGAEHEHKSAFNDALKLEPGL